MGVFLGDGVEVSVIEGIDAGELGGNRLASAFLDGVCSEEDFLNRPGTSEAMNPAQCLAQISRAEGR
jgi:hypothetical protein